MSAERSAKLRRHMFHLVIITIAGAMIYGLPYFRSYFYDAYLEAYNLKTLEFGVDYVIPKPLDPRILTTMTPAVAQAAMTSGVARRPLENPEAYARQVADRVRKSNERIESIIRSYQNELKD